MTPLYVGGERELLVFEAAADGLRQLQSVTVGAMPSFLSFATSRRALYVAVESDDAVASLRLDDEGLLHTTGHCAAEGGPAYVALDRSERFVLSASYGSGELHVARLDEAGVLAGRVASLAVGRNAHAVRASHDNRRLYVPCKGDDCVVELDFDASSGRPSAPRRLSCPSGSGPRHLAFSADEERMYVVCENDCSLLTFVREGSSYRLASRVETLPRAFRAGDTGADLHLSGDQRFLYVTNRGHDSLSIFSLAGEFPERLDNVPSVGAWPRNFGLNGERELWLGGQESSTVERFSRDPSTGRLRHEASFAVNQRVFWVGTAKGAAAP
ncbi:MAG TPA: beta-propeller fold lactonase family protein [Polyangiaceae bacterium]|nr:beta-propeller fold lactonase family protein [Polyangiaceae bacterium]